MPVYNITEPQSGVKFRLTGDSAPTEQELEDIFSQLSVPDKPEARESSWTDVFTGEDRTTEIIEGLEEIGAAPELNELSMGALKASFGLLSTGNADELKSILKTQYGENVDFREDKKGNVIVDLPSGSYALNKPGLSGQDIIRGVFDIASYVPASRAASIPSAIASSAATEAAIESGEALVGGDFSPEDVVVSAGLGGLFKGVEDSIGAGYRAIKGDASQEVVEKGAEAGIDVMTSDIKQPENFFAKIAQSTVEKIPFAGTGSAREAQQAQRELAVNNLAEKYGQFSYSAVVDSLKNQKNRVKRAAGSVLQGTGERLDDAGRVPLSFTKKAILDAERALDKKGVIKSEGALDDISLLINTLSESPQSFTTLKENRTAFNDIIKGFDKAERSQLGSRAMSEMQKIAVAMTKDMTGFAKENLPEKQFQKWQKANRVWSDEAQKLTKTRLKSVLDKGDVTPEAVETLLFSSKPSEVRSLYNSLDKSGKDNARSAIISKVVSDLGKRKDGLTPNAFVTEMKKRQIPLDVFFKGQDKKQLYGLLKVLDSTKRAQEAAVQTPTGQQLLGAGTVGAAVVDLGATLGTAGTLGTAARIYESKPVRDALIRLGSVPKGSTRFEQYLKEAQSAISSASQAEREELTQ